MEPFVLPRPSNLHGHLRSGSMLPLTTLHAAYNKYYTAMPNLEGAPVDTPEKAASYKTEIIRFLPEDSSVNLVIPCYLRETTTPEVIDAGFKNGIWTTAKLYPRGGTTNSGDGVRMTHLYSLRSVFELMQELGMILLVHGEMVEDFEGNEVDVFDRERMFLESVLTRLTVEFPRLKIVFEHVSNEQSVQFVRKCQKLGHPVEATVAPQYLIYNRNELFRGGMCPAKYSIPVLKRERDREALCEFVTQGGGFRGNDSAPHLVQHKSSPCGCKGGIFSDAHGIDLIVYYEVFKKAGALDRFAEFCSLKGPRFYGLPEPSADDTISIIEKEWKVPPEYLVGTDRVIPLCAGEILRHSVTWR